MWVILNSFVDEAQGFDGFFYVIMPIKIPRTLTENNYAGMKSLIYALAILQKIEKLSM